jgi:arginase
MISIVGIPLDENSSYLRGAASAPDVIRKSLYSDSSNLYAENGFDLSQPGNWRFAGDLQLSAMPAAFNEITSGIEAALRENEKVISLGGDHSITYPIVKAFARPFGKLNILHIDAHADLYNDFEGNQFSHACPFARIMEEGLASELVQVGIRTLTQHHREQIKRFGVRTIEMKDWRDDVELRFQGPLYVSLDLDAIDPAFVPGVSHHEPGGFSVRQVIHIIQRLKGNIVGADLVEFNPTRDLNGMTGMVAAKLLKELLAKMID